VVTAGTMTRASSRVTGCSGTLGQVRLAADGYALVDHPAMPANVPGVFACGDLIDHRYRHAMTAAGTGCAAALGAERELESLADALRTGDPKQAAVVSAL